MPDDVFLAKANDIELLALRLDVDQMEEIARGQQLNIIKKTL